jgi:cyclopropane fatty-acyl-phospholipid synthase-like methyltransferase
MAHPQQQDFCRLVKATFPEYFDNVNVCDIGSLDINGSNHYLFTKYTYMGVDIGRGRNVNFISKGHEFKPLGIDKYDTVISTEAFEHDMYWKETIQNVIDNLLKPKGMFLFTCATTGRAEHGTRRTTPTDSPFTSEEQDSWSDYYYNLTETDMKYAIDFDNYFSAYHFYVNHDACDLYFWGILK